MAYYRHNMFVSHSHEHELSNHVLSLSTGQGFCPSVGPAVSEEQEGQSARALRTYMWLNLRRSVALKDLVTLILRSQTGEYVQQRWW